jgi:hypothetical protein
LLWKKKRDNHVWVEGDVPAPWTALSCCLQNLQAERFIINRVSCSYHTNATGSLSEFQGLIFLQNFPFFEVSPEKRASPALSVDFLYTLTHAHTIQTFQKIKTHSFYKDWGHCSGGEWRRFQSATFALLNSIFPE